MKQFFALVKAFIAEIDGVYAYERFCMHYQESHPEIPCPSRREFFKLEQERKWKGINRCC